jgi:4,5-DOPA dioxygenase extradiol
MGMGVRLQRRPRCLNPFIGKNHPFKQVFLMSDSQPAVFVSHGSPMVAIQDGAYQQALKAFGDKLTPTSILVVSAHWDSGRTVSITDCDRNTLIYDFGGFPRELYELKYDAPGSKSLASEVASQLDSKFKVELDSSRGLDHGAWVPLRLMFPKADIPVVELSIPTSLSPQELFELGRQLAPLRERGTLILGSGGIVHNLRTVDFHAQHGSPEAWAEKFNRWFAETLEARDIQQLFNYESAPNSKLAVPTPEHFVPVFVVMGAAENSKAPETIFEGFEYRTISMRSFWMR